MKHKINYYSLLIKKTMKKRLFFLICFYLSVLVSSGQRSPGGVLTTPNMADDVVTTAEEIESSKAIDSLIREKSKLLKRRDGNEYSIPVVVHIIHDGDLGNITDEQVLAGIQHLNDAFDNITGESVETGIAFCLAVRDPEGNATTGINRIESSLTVFDKNIDQGMSVKSLIQWDPTSYLNIWIVSEIYKGTDPGVAGFSTLHTSHGSAADGVVMEERYFGTTFENSSVITHEVGHYLGLYHTFQGQCINNNCMEDGDQVCDTPPDLNGQDYSCTDETNSCHSDEDDESDNNPFRAVALGGLGDQPDMKNNYMDYSHVECYTAFTEGQKIRMQSTMETIRYSLTESMGCVSPCMSSIVADFSTTQNIYESGENIQFTNNSTGGLYHEWLIDGIVFSTEHNPIYSINTQGDYEITLNVTNDDPNCFESFSSAISITCEAEASFIYSNLTASPGDAVHFNNTSVNATQYEWYINDVLSGTEEQFSPVFNAEGNYDVYLVASNGICNSISSEVVVTVSPEQLPQSGLPVWPLAVAGDVPAQVIDWRTATPVTSEITTTNTSSGMSGAAFGKCGELLFYVLHSGSGDDNNLLMYAADGLPLLDNSDADHQGFSGVKGGQELQVVAVPQTQDEWYVIYKKWITDVGSWASGGHFEAANWLYSRVQYSNNILTVLERDVVLTDGAGISYTYADGAAVSRTANGDASKHYLYLSRRSEGQDILSVDRFIIDNTGIDFDVNSGNVVARWWNGTIAGSPIELSPTESKLAVIARNDYTDAPFVFIFDAIDLNSTPESICARDLTLQADGGANDESSILSTSGIVSEIASSNSDLEFLENMNRRILGIEFSPNGKFLYFSGGGFVQTSHFMTTYIGQVDLESIAPHYDLRLQIQEVDDFDPASGNGCSYSSCMQTTNVIYNIESCYDGNIYFSKRNVSRIYVIPEPNNFMPQNLVPSQVDLSTAAEPNVEYAQGFSANLPDQIDGYNYLESNYTEVELLIKSFDCAGQCSSSDIDYAIDIIDESTDVVVKTINISSCPVVIPFCAENDKTYSLRGSLFGREYASAISNGELMYSEFVFAMDPFPDATISIESTECRDSSLLVNANICNQGSNMLIAGVPIALYNGDPFSGGTIISTSTIGTNISVGSCVDVQLEVSTNLSEMSLFVVVNDNGTLAEVGQLPVTTFAECNYSNNIASIDVDYSVPVLDLGDDVTICSTGGTINLDAGEGFVSYLWHDGLDLQLYTAYEAGTYSVTVTDVCGNTYTDEVEVTIDDSELDVLFDETICRGDEYSVDLNEFVDFDFSVDGEIVTSTPEVYTITPSQNAVLSITAINSNGCYVVDESTLTVENCGGSCVVTAGDDVTICQGESASLSSTLEGCEVDNCNNPEQPSVTCDDCLMEISGSAAANVNSGDVICVGEGSTFNGGLNMNGGTLIVCGDFNPAYINYNSGEIILFGTNTIANLNMNSNSGVLKNYGTVTFQNITFNGTVENHGTATFENDFNVNSTAATLINTGIMYANRSFDNGLNTINNGTITIAGSLRNNSGGSFENNCTVEVGNNFFNDSNSEFQNNGSILVANETTIQPGLFNSNAGSSLSTNSIIVNGTIVGDAIECSLINVNGNSRINSGAQFVGILNYCDKDGVEYQGVSFGDNVALDCSCNASIGGSSVLVNWIPVDGVSNPNSLNTSVTPDATTTYVITVEDAEGNVSTDEVTVTVNDCGGGGVTPPVGTSVSLSPNPFTTSVTVLVEDPDSYSAQIRVLDVMGNQVHETWVATNQSTEVYLGWFNSGTYTFEINTENIHESIVVIKN